MEQYRSRGNSLDFQEAKKPILETLSESREHLFASLSSENLQELELQPPPPLKRAGAPPADGAEQKKGDSIETTTEENLEGESDSECVLGNFDNSANKRWIDQLYQTAESRSLDDLIQEAKRHWQCPGHNPEVEDDEAEKEKWHLHFNAIGMKLACYNAACLVPLVETLECLGPAAFLRLAIALKERGIEGHFIRWAFDACDRDLIRFQKVILEGDPKVFEKVNREAELYEDFCQHEKIGRLDCDCCSRRVTPAPSPLPASAASSTLETSTQGAFRSIGGSTLPSQDSSSILLKVSGAVLAGALLFVAWNRYRSGASRTPSY